MRRLRVIDVAAIIVIAASVFVCSLVVFAAGRTLQELFGVS
tara:strand:+ start:265 stop:387 length:123 start_codon:yes stop_codon:yes gene_type:complete